jgi:hypothetical protein
MAQERARILIVEDERVVAWDLKESLESMGYDAYAIAATADEAIVAATRRMPDLVLMDIRIQGTLDGIETARLLRERMDVPVVYLTAYADDAIIERVKATDPYGFLVKPVRMPELRSVAELALDRHRKQRRLREAARAELEASEARLCAILDSVAYPILAVDLSGLVTSANPEAAALFGWSSDPGPRAITDVLSMPWPPNEGGAPPISADAEVIAPADIAGVRGDGTRFPARVATNRVAIDGEPQYILAIHDLTVEREHERQVLAECDETRRRIGSDLHDGLGQLLIGTAYLAKEIEAEVPPSARAKVERLGELVARGIEATQNLARGLAPCSLENVTLAEALAEMAQRCSNEVLACRFVQHPMGEEPDLHVRTQLFLIAQEAVANAVRHGRPSRVELELGRLERWRVLRVSDDGRGMGACAESSGLGLRSMAQRARLIGGTLELAKSAFGGVEIRCIW